MNSLQIAALNLVAGFALVLVASFAGPPGIYQEPDSEVRLEIIAEYPNRWRLSNALFALGGILTALGLLLLSLELRGNLNSWILAVSAGAYSLGAALWVFFMYRRTVDPASLFTSYAFSPLTIALLALTLIGLFFFGVVFLQAGYPLWLGAGTIAGITLTAAVAVFFPARFFDSFPPQLLYFFSLAAGIVLLAQ